MLAIRVFVCVPSISAVPCFFDFNCLAKLVGHRRSPVLRTELCGGHSVQRPRNVVVWTVLLAVQLSLWSLKGNWKVTSLAEVQREITAFPPLPPTSRRVRQSYVRNRENSLESSNMSSCPTYNGIP